VKIRAAVSNGCVRMLNAHVQKLYELVEVGTPVRITR
jgi:lipoprotein-anchoring transpeptidase ErfK/SrfK